MMRVAGVTGNVGSQVARACWRAVSRWGRWSARPVVADLNDPSSFGMDDGRAKVSEEDRGGELDESVVTSTVSEVLRRAPHTFQDWVAEDVDAFRTS
jgi:hypothetical protein